MRDEHELHDLLKSLVALPLSSAEGCRHWATFFDWLEQAGRGKTVTLHGIPCWAATERLPQLAGFESDGPPPEVVRQYVQGWLQILGPTTAAALGKHLALDPGPVYQALLAMEMQGLALRGSFEQPTTDDPHQIEWCERRILQRIHRLTLGTLRKQVEPVTPSVFMRWLLGWQHLAPQTQLTGEEGVLEALTQLGRL